MRVLVVDDSRAMRMIVSRELRNIDAVSAVLEADSAESAIELLPIEPVDLILCDWNMGGMTGLEFLQALRAADWLVPFGFVTSESSEAILASAFAAGAAFLIAKPFTGAELTSKIESYLSGASVAGVSDGALGKDRPMAVAELLEGLLRKPVKVVPVEEGPARQVARWTADYVDAQGCEAAICVVETPIAAGMSAALTLMSPAVATQWSSSGTLPDVLSENFHEITNVLSKVVRTDGARCILRGVAGFAPGEKLPDAERIGAAPSCEHFRVTLDDYGTGLMSLVTL
ncbi:MAG: response regulator receiver protein [Acidimicrobiaceae bacterium]|nr:response regulator receiver protein [Acidimicrobiaceae bacterium]